MPEWGMIPMPKALLKKGIRDMVRMSDARMSGTSYGACVLHIAPEAYVGGPLALVQNGDMIELDIPNRSLSLLVSDAELAQRKQAWVPPPARYERGYGFMFSKHIEQADKGCDFDFLKTEFGGPVSEPEIH
jgi:dihydroxy-acid dehydratase